MIFHTALVGLFLATAVSAIPVETTTLELNSTKWTPDHVLQQDEVILYGDDGRMEVVHESVYKALMEKEGVSFDLPEVDEDYLHRNVTAPKHDQRDVDERSSGDLEARAFSCSATNSVITDRTQTFIDWDVQMSPVVIGAGKGGIDIYVSSGYSVSNSISVGGGAEWTFIKDKLSATLHIDYTRTWTTSTAIQIRVNVPNGYSGVMITKPITTRRYGRTMRGCIGSMTQTGTFMADDHKETSYNGVKWISGAITVCAKKQFPLTRCAGSGTFI